MAAQAKLKSNLFVQNSVISDLRDLEELTEGNEDVVSTNKDSSKPTDSRK